MQKSQQFGVYDPHKNNTYFKINPFPHSLKGYREFHVEHANPEGLISLITNLTYELVKRKKNPEKLNLFD